MRVSHSFIAAAISTSIISLSHHTTALAASDELVAAAKGEGTVVLYTTVDLEYLVPFVDKFKEKYPGINVEYNDLNSLVIHNRMVSETAAGGPTADVVMQPAVDLALQAANAGMIQAYKLDDPSSIPSQFNYKDMVYNPWNEPVCNVYNTTYVPKDKLPHKGAELAAALKASPDIYTDKIGAYDIEKSALGFFYLNKESHLSSTFWDAMKEFGALGAKFYSSAGIVTEMTGSGELNFGYNIPCTTAIKTAKANPQLGVHFYDDYVQVQAQPTFVPAKAAHPNAGKLMLDFFLSKEGQSINSKQVGWIPVRSDVQGQSVGLPETAQVDAVSFEGEKLKINLEPLDRSYRLDFLKNWKEAVKR